MTIKEKLIDLLTDNLPRCGNLPHWDNPLQLSCDEQVERIADHLIAHGVTVQELDGCKYCKEYEDLPEHFIDGKPIGRVFDTCIQRNENGLWHLEAPCGADIGIRFCPMCGRELPQPPKGE